VTTVWRYKVLPFFQRLPGAAGAGNLLRTERVGAIQSHQQRAAKAYKRFQTALPVQLVTGLRHSGYSVSGAIGSRRFADLAGRGNLMDTENRLRIVPVVELLHATLIVQKRRALCEKDRERA